MSLYPACKECGAPIERSIEGELICENCWTMSQWSEEDWAFYRELLWFKTHCVMCEKQFFSGIIEKHGGYCKPCYEEMKASLEKLL